ncbi:two-component regulator propeller domain-containing protein [Candidatus Omnitrophota bacterium]
MTKTLLAINLVFCFSVSVLSGEAHGKGTWEIFTSTRNIMDIASQGDFIWIATDGGVVRWNKHDKTFVKFTIDDGLLHNNVMAVAPSHDGSVWFGTNTGISHFKDNTWTVYDHGILNYCVREITVDNEGGIWTGGATRTMGITHYDGEKWTEYTYADDRALYTWSIEIDSRGVIWAATMHGLFSFRNGVWNFHSETGSPGKEWIYSVDSEPGGIIWCGTFEGKVFKYDGESWESYTEAAGLSWSRIWDICIAPDGDIWFAAKNGLTRYDGKSWETITLDEEFSQYTITELDIDDDGDVWIGTWGAGLFRYDGVEWESFLVPNEPASNSFRCLASGYNDKLWCGTERGVSSFDGSNWISYSTSDGMESGSISTIQVSRNGDIWAASTHGGGISHFNGEQWETFTTADGLIDNYIRSFSVNSEGHVWAGFNTISGVSYFDGSSWTSIAEFENLLVHDIAVDHYDTVWIATKGGGIYAFNNTQWTAYDTDDGLVDNNIYRVAAGNDGSLWCQTKGVLYKFNDQSWTSFPKLAYSIHANSIIDAVDSKGTVWLISPFYTGAYTFDGEIVSHVNYYEGFRDLSFNAVTSGPEGEIWLASAYGLFRYLPDGSHTKVSDPTVQNPTILLNGNYPNPFNQTTTIEFALPREMMVELSIYNVMGQKVRTLLNDSYGAGNHRVIWDGRDDEFRYVSSGVYITNLISENNSINRSMLLMK